MRRSRPLAPGGPACTDRADTAGPTPRGRRPSRHPTARRPSGRSASGPTSPPSWSSTPGSACGCRSPCAAVLVVFVAATVLFGPARARRATCAAVAVGYAVAALGVAAWARDGGVAVARWAWLALFLDLAVLAWLTLLTGSRPRRAGRRTC